MSVLALVGGMFVRLSVAEGIPFITSSDPPNCAIDAREPHALNDASVKFGWDEIELTFSEALPVDLAPDDFSITEVGGDGFAPTIDTVVVSPADTATLTLSGSIEPGAWTQITHDASGTSASLGYLPGDVDGNRLTAVADLNALINCVNNPGTCQQRQCDIDRNGACGAADLLRLVDLLNGAGSFDVWADETLDDCPIPAPHVLPCCLLDGSCVDALASTCAAQAGVSHAVGSTCRGDGNGDGVDDECAYGGLGYGNRTAMPFGAPNAGAFVRLGDDIEIVIPDARLSAYELGVQGSGGAFSVEVALATDPCDPGSVIPGTEHTFTGVPGDGNIHVLVWGFEPPVAIPGMVWMTAMFDSPDAGWVIAEMAEVGFTQDVFALDDPGVGCNPGASFGGAPWAGFSAAIWAATDQACWPARLVST